jgi:presenilin-like A22 family membrane protease
MKHKLNVTLILIAFFIAAEIFGLYAISRDMKVSKAPTGEIITVHPDTAVGARPDIRNSQTLIYIAVSVLIGTVLILLLAKFRKPKIWKAWFFLAVWSAMSICLGVFMKPWIAISVALALSAIKILKPNPISHNITELLIYAGIALMIVPLLNAVWAFLLLIAFSIYDMIAVWKSRHMISLAKFQMDSKVFAGLSIPYSLKQGEKEKTSEMNYAPSKKTAREKAAKPAAKSEEGQPQLAILGGGDIALPMIFAGSFMEWTIRGGLSKASALLHASVIIAFASVALALLLFKSEKGKFYPAMPFLTAGCAVGAIAAMLI